VLPPVSLFSAEWPTTEIRVQGYELSGFPGGANGNKFRNPRDRASGRPTVPGVWGRRMPSAESSDRSLSPPSSRCKKSPSGAIRPRSRSGDRPLRHREFFETLDYHVKHVDISLVAKELLGKQSLHRSVIPGKKLSSPLHFICRFPPKRFMAF